MNHIYMVTGFSHNPLHIKMGFDSSAVGTRLKAHQSGRPHSKLKILATYPCPTEAHEQTIHNALRRAGHGIRGCYDKSGVESKEVHATFEVIDKFIRATLGNDIIATEYDESMQTKEMRLAAVKAARVEAENRAFNIATREAFDKKMADTLKKAAEEASRSARYKVAAHGIYFYDADYDALTISEDTVKSFEFDYRIKQPTEEDVNHFTVMCNLAKKRYEQRLAASLLIKKKELLLRESVAREAEEARIKEDKEKIESAVIELSCFVFVLLAGWFYMYLQDRAILETTLASCFYEYL